MQSPNDGGVPLEDENPREHGPHASERTKKNPSDRSISLKGDITY